MSATSDCVRVISHLVVGRHGAGPLTVAGGERVAAGRRSALPERADLALERSPRRLAEAREKAKAANFTVRAVASA